MSLPINLPPRVVKDMAVTAVWANSIREAIARLANRRISNKRGGGGGGGSDNLGPLSVTESRPAWIEAPVTPPAEGFIRVWVTWGTINSRAATNLTDHFDINVSKQIFAKATFTTTGAFALTSWEIVVEAIDFVPPAPTGPRPENGYYLLGSTLSIDESFPALMNNGEGSLNVWPQVSNSVTSGAADTVIVWSRDG